MGKHPPIITKELFDIVRVTHGLASTGKASMGIKDNSRSSIYSTVGRVAHADGRRAFQKASGRRQKQACILSVHEIDKRP